LKNKKKIKKNKNLVLYDKIVPSLNVFNSDRQSLTFICTGNESQTSR